MEGINRCVSYYFFITVCFVEDPASQPFLIYGAYFLLFYLIRLRKSGYIPIVKVENGAQAVKILSDTVHQNPCKFSNHISSTCSIVLI